MSATLTQWLKPEDLATELEVPLRTIYVWNHTGKGPALVRVGKHVRYSRQAVDDWLTARTEAGEVG
jgi:excisionase family DNA binding protein